MEDPSHYTKDVPLTPTAQQHHDPPVLYQVEHFAIGFEHPIDVDALKRIVSSSIITLQIPRLSSLLVKHNNGRQYWRRTQVDIEKHFIVHHQVLQLQDDHDHDHGDEEDAVNDYLAALACAAPLTTDKPLWEMHMLMDVRCLVFRVHHAIGDGTSMVALIRAISENGASCGREKTKSTTVNNWRRRSEEGLSGYFRYMWFSAAFCLKFVAKSTFVRDKKSVLNAKDYVDYSWPQKLATARFNLEDLKVVKKAIPNATINDILCGIIWGGFLKYIDARSSTIALKEGQKITGVLMADLRKHQGLQDLCKMQQSNLESWWGNKTGIFLLPIYYTKRIVDPLDYVRKAKSILDKKKKSAEPRLALKLRNLLLRLGGVKVMNYFTYKVCSNATFAFSNVVGPSEQISFAGNPVKYLRVSVSSSPLRIVLHLLSYMNNLDLQILVAEEVIPDPKFLASCIRDTFQEMKDAIR